MMLTGIPLAAGSRSGATLPVIGKLQVSSGAAQAADPLFWAKGDQFDSMTKCYFMRKLNVLDRLRPCYKECAQLGLLAKHWIGSKTSFE